MSMITKSLTYSTVLVTGARSIAPFKSVSNKSVSKLNEAVVIARWLTIARARVFVNEIDFVILIPDH
jgi:hypothetical protein